MEKEINIAEILKDKPKGTKLYSSACGKCELKEADDKSFKISFYSSKSGFMNGGEGTFDKNGNLYDDGECIVFPSKEMRDWHKFAWKNGDILVNCDKDVHIIFEAFENDTYTRFKGKHYLWKEGNEEDYCKEETFMLTSVFEKANDDAVKCYINTIEERLGGKLNMETLEVEKSQPEFKDGDILSCDEDTYTKHTILIFHKNGDIRESIVSLIRHEKLVEANEPIDDFFLSRFYYAREDEKQQLFDALAKEGKAWDAEKKIIVDLKPKIELKSFDKVLCRDYNTQKWEAELFGFKSNTGRYHCVGGTWSQCIPYIGNESLLGTKKMWRSDYD